jgi:hypothetical protein
MHIGGYQQQLWVVKGSRCRSAGKPNWCHKKGLKLLPLRRSLDLVASHVLDVIVCISVLRCARKRKKLLFSLLSKIKMAWNENSSLSKFLGNGLLFFINIVWKSFIWPCMWAMFSFSQPCLSQEVLNFYKVWLLYRDSPDYPYLAGNHSCLSPLTDYWVKFTWFLPFQRLA